MAPTCERRVPRRAGEKNDPDEPEDHALGRSRGGFGSKFHLMTDGRGTPLNVVLTAGQVHESTQFRALLLGRRPPGHVGWPMALAGDKAYSSREIRGLLDRRHIEPVIPMRDNQIPEAMDLPLNRKVYKRRNAIEWAVGWLKESRRVGTRFKKLAMSFLAMLHLAIMKRYLRMLTG